MKTRSNQDKMLMLYDFNSNNIKNKLDLSHKA